MLNFIIVSAPMDGPFFIPSRHFSFQHNLFQPMDSKPSPSSSLYPTPITNRRFSSPHGNLHQLCFSCSSLKLPHSQFSSSDSSSGEPPSALRFHIRSFRPSFPPTAYREVIMMLSGGSATMDSVSQGASLNAPIAVALIDESRIPVGSGVTLTPAPPLYVAEKCYGFQRGPKRIYMVGVRHGEKDSVERVRQVLKAVEPKHVMVELCSARQSVLYGTEQQEQQVLKGDGSLTSRDKDLGGKQMFSGDISLDKMLWSGFNQAAQLLQDKLAIQIGEEMTAVREYAKKSTLVKHRSVSIHLGDRDIEISLKRFVSLCTFSERVSWLFQLLLLSFHTPRTPSANVSSRDTTSTRTKTIPGPTWLSSSSSSPSPAMDNLMSISSTREMIRRASPALFQAVYLEREEYMAYCLRDSPVALSTMHEQDVVMIVGEFHVDQIKEILLDRRRIDKEQLMKIELESHTDRYMNGFVQWGISLASLFFLF